MCRRGDIYNVDFGKNTESRKQYGIRPALVVSNNQANQYSPVITVIPLTSRIYNKRFLPTHVLIPKSCGSGLERDSLALAEQVEALDKTCLLEKRGTIEDKMIMAKVTRALQIQIGAVDRYN